MRQEGNEAAHSWQRDFRDGSEVEELLILGGRNIRRLRGLRSLLPN